MKKFFTKKKIIWTIIIVLVLGIIGYQIFKPKNNSANIQTEITKKQNLKLTVLATGQVVSSTDLNLSFKTSGVVSKISVAEGSKVKSGQTLAVLSQSDQQAQVTSARGSVAQAEANYQKVLAGASSQDIDVAQKAVDAAQVALNTANINLQNTKSQQDTAVKNAYSTLLNSTLTAVPAQGNLGNATVTVSGTYVGSDQGVYNISLYSTGTGLMFSSNGLESGGGAVKTTPVPLGSRGLFIQFTGNPSASDTWTVTIPNTVAANYVTNYNAYQTALNTKQSSLDAAVSQVSSAQASLAQAQASLRVIWNLTTATGLAK